MIDYTYVKALCMTCRGSGQYCTAYPRYFSPCPVCRGAGKEDVPMTASQEAEFRADGYANQYERIIGGPDRRVKT